MTTSLKRSGTLWTLPNMITMARLATIPVLLWAIYAHHETFFSWLFMISLVSDILDGVIARALKMTSPLGALLDSTADMALTIVALIGVPVFHPAFVSEHSVMIAVMLACYFLTIACALFRYGKLASFHLYSSRVTAYAQGFFLICLFMGNTSAKIFYPVMTLSILSYSEVLLLIALLPKWTPNARGLYWILKVRRQTAAVPAQ